MSEHSRQLKRLREHLTYYEAATALADRVSKVGEVKRKGDNVRIAWLEGMCRYTEAEFYGSRTASALVRLKALEDQRGIKHVGEVPTISNENLKDVERSVGPLLDEYENALQKAKGQRYGNKLAAIESRLKRMEEADVE